MCIFSEKKNFIIKVIFALIFLYIIEVYLIKIIKNIRIQSSNLSKGNPSDRGKFDILNDNSDKGYYSSDNYNLKIIHLIITRFMIEFHPYDGFPKKPMKKLIF